MKKNLFYWTSGILEFLYSKLCRRMNASLFILLVLASPSFSVVAYSQNTSNKLNSQQTNIVSGVVIKFNKHGALVSIKQGVAGLVHNSGFGSEEIFLISAPDDEPNTVSRKVSLSKGFRSAYSCPTPT